MMDMGPEAITQMARNLGIKSPIGDNLSSALGASEVTPMELTGAYSVFPNMGVRVTPVLIKKIVDRSGNVLEDNTVTPLDILKRAKEDIEKGVCVSVPKSLEAEQKQVRGADDTPESKPGCRVFEADRPNMVRVMSPQAAYLMVSMLREVTVSGTASSASRMRRPDVGGKTGTTNDYTDAWFIGFNPKYTTGVWIGYDARSSLGTKEFGGKAALPVWMEYMSYALRSDKPRIWPPPSGIEFARASPPSFAPDRQLKQVSPVDVIPIPVSAGLTGYSMGWAPVPYGALSQYGLVRVLSPRGKTVGLASYAQDEKGNLVLQKVPALSFSPEGFGFRQ
jgi:penicillin-binding protein 1A